MSNYSVKDGTRVVRIACAVLFVSFTFLYLYDYQDDILAMAQHVLSDGLTHYNRTIGAVLITVVLWLLQIGFYALFRLQGRAHAITFFPSLLTLAVITSPDNSIDEGFTFGAWIVAWPVLMLICIGVMWYARQVQQYEPVDSSKGFLSRRAWINYVTMCVMFVFVGLFSNHNDVFHYRMHVESCLNDSLFDEALATGEKSNKTDSSLTSLRIHALAEKNQLGERLFEYPLVGGSAAMLPNGKSVKYLMYPEKNLYKNLGCWLKQHMSTMHYLKFVHRHKLATKSAHDYLLCAYLLDGNLDAFVHSIGLYYDIHGQMPKHYREALTLYNHLRSNPFISYRSTIMETDFQDFQTLIHKYNNPVERAAALRDTYGNTYWWYYYNLYSCKSKYNL